MSEFAIEKIEQFANALLPSMGLELVEVQFRREGHGWVLRLFIDCEQGITVDHCADVSREISHYLDVEDLIDHQYHLEVSSPGLERPLKRPADYARFVGRKVKIKVREPIEGQSVFTGILEATFDHGIDLSLDGDSRVSIPYSIIRKGRLAL